MPKIVRFHELGGPEVLKLEETDIPSPQDGEVLIKVKALGLNRAEALFRAGNYLEKAVLPSKLGYEASGVVESVGKGVTDVSPGDTVSLIPVPSQAKYGVYGEYAIAPAFCVVKHPENISFEEAAATWMQYLTAYGALVEIAKISRGDFVVITAASSSVGLAAIQLCNLVGAIPVATTRTSKKKEELITAGAKHVIVTEEENLKERLLEITEGQGARVAFDPVGGKSLALLAEGMAQKGIIIIYGALSLEPTPFPLKTALSKGLTMRGYVLFELIQDTSALAKALKNITEGLSSKKLKPVIAKTFKLSEIVEAHTYLESNQQFGKIVVQVVS